jgi:DNA-binding NtrC family response regulator
MNKAPKAARIATANHGHILYAENDSEILAQQSKIFERAGYTVERIQGRAAVEVAVRKGHYDVVILGHTLTKDDRHHLPYMAKKADRYATVMVLHASGKHPAVDIAMDSREGDDAVLKALAMLVEHKTLAAVS